ncbi:MAG: glycosyltransferase family 4 protein [Actinobacteria bacterium]|nr:glycosyltransferase family 4 protein [Actinomycetota bacterium]
MRVALICPYSLSVFGGVQTQVKGLHRALSRAGHETVVLAPTDEPVEGDGVVAVGRSIGIRANGSVAPISPWPSSWMRTLAEIREGRFDVVHVHEPFVPGPSLATVLRSPVPVVGTFHQSGWAWPYAATFPIVRLVGRRLSRCVAVSESAAAMVRGPLGRDVEVLWNGVELANAVADIKWVKEGPTIAFVSRHETRKGLEVLLRAMAHLAPDVRLWVMGEGPLTDDLKRAYGSDPRISWLGRPANLMRDSRLRQADVYCAPNLGGESFGLVLAEAMAVGAPVVASDLDAFRAVARPELDEAVLVPPGDPLALASALRKVLADAALRERMRTAGLARAAELSMDRLADRYLELYASARSEGQLG